MSVAEAETAKLNKKSLEWQESLWRKWPSPEQWPGVLDIYEAAAYLRVEYKSIWSACQPGRDKKCRLAHQRIGAGKRAAYRFQRAALDRFGAVQQREVA